MRAALALLVVAACAGPAPAPAVDRDRIAFVGACDASGAVPLGPDFFVVGDDEDNVLRVYDVRRGGQPVAHVDVSAALSAELSEEVDIEAATRVGDHALWIASHARTKAGHPAPARLRLFATTAPPDGTGIRVVGSTDRLLDAILAEPQFADLGLQAATALPPGASGGLNIEGMTARAEGGVWIGFRSPTVGERAIVLPLFDPLELIAGEPARFGPPVLLDLGGAGIRSLSHWRGQYLIVGGHYAHGSVSRLFTWDGIGVPRQVAGVDLTGMNAEAFFSRDDRDAILLISDDGDAQIAGQRCKKLRDPNAKGFHGRWIALPEPLR
jgi:hypothetical protein